MGSVQDLVGPAEHLAGHITNILKNIRGIEIDPAVQEQFHQCTAVFDLFDSVSSYLRAINRTSEADVISHVAYISKTSANHGGLGLDRDSKITDRDVSELQFLITAWVEALSSEEHSKRARLLIGTKPAGRRPMTLAEKIFASHDVDGKGFVRPGDMIRVSVDWVMASEASWGSMERTYEQLGKPGIFRNDRFWLAGDHVVHPKVVNHPTVARLIQSSERARKVFKMTEYQGMNYTIMHTEFYRERAQPGMIVIGSDSHTCSSGAVGCLAIGLGAADVTMGLVTGEMWFKVPECVNIYLVGKPPSGIGGKDVILYILQQLKRNTVAADRVVEYTGPGIKYLSSDARFAVANMTTEFGGITGVFVPDAVTDNFIKSRKLARHKRSSMYFKPDEDAEYAETCIIDLSQTESFVAKYPNPDDVVPVEEMNNTQLDGCFIGACTTAEEDIVLGALVLEQGLKNGLRPTTKGTRKVVPGSMPIVDRLRSSGLAEIYERAGFEIGVPGCSYCVGMSADRAKEGEVWLSSQNRNFENRMGKGSIGNLASAATVAASSFEMRIRNPRGLIDQIPHARWEGLKGRGSLQALEGAEPQYVEPFGAGMALPSTSPTTMACEEIVPSDDSPESHSGQAQKQMISGRVQRLGDFIDTDALAPAQFLVESRTNEALGAHCLEFTHPKFRDRVKEGFNIVVAGRAFGCGSSREQAVSALLGCGVDCVIARSFAFIYSRNQPSLGLLGITLTDDEFFEAAQDGASLTIDVASNVIVVDGREFPFQLSRMERELMDLGGITPAFLKFGKQIFDALCTVGTGAREKARLEQAEEAGCSGSSPLQW